jgi:hypothetical protein
MAYFNTTTSITGTPDAIANTPTTNQILFTEGTVAAPVISFQTPPTALSAGVWYNNTGINPAATLQGVAISGPGGVLRAQFGATSQTFVSNTTIDATLGPANLYTNGADSWANQGNIQTHGAVAGALPAGKIISGNPGVVLGGGLVRASVTASCDWEDGHLGNTQRLHFTASDVMPLTPGRQFWTMNGGGGIPRHEPPVAAATIADFQTYCVSKVIPTGFTTGKTMSIITQGGPAGAVPSVGALALSGGGARLEVYYYEVGGAGSAPGTWNPPGVDITPVAPAPLRTDTELILNPTGAATPTSGTGSAGVGASTLFIGMTFTIPTMGPPPNGILGGYFDIERR